MSTEKTHIKIGNTTFNIVAIKALGWENFQKQFKGILKTDIKETFKKITGIDPDKTKTASYETSKKPK